MPNSGAAILPLFIEGRGFSGHSLPLYISGEQIIARTLKLFIKGLGNPINVVLPLVIWNQQVTATLPLFVQGGGTTQGALPANATLNLFLKRNPTAMLPLVALGSDRVTATLPLYTLALDSINATLPLSIPKVVGKGNFVLPLFIRGF